MEHLIDRALADDPTATMVGVRQGQITMTPLAEFPNLVHSDAQRSRGTPWWMALRPVADLMARLDQPPPMM